MCRAVFDEELEAVQQLVRRIALAGVDAVIVQVKGRVWLLGHERSFWHRQ
jgi:collagenase-like PrtC family protease